MSTSQQNLPATNGVEIALASSEPTVDLRYKLDVEKLHSLPSEQQDLYLFTFVSDLEQHVRSLNHDGICAEQAIIKEDLYQVVELPTPAPTRVIRNGIGRCFGHILENGDRKPLYESVNRLLAVVNAGKNERPLQNKHAAVHCLGEVYRTAGDSAITLSNLACSSLIKLSKAAQNHVGLKAAILRALKSVVSAVRGALDEGIAKDIWKYSRSMASNDKAGLVQARACATLGELVKSTDHFDTTNDFESLKTTVWKVTDSPMSAARCAAAACLTIPLVKSFSEVPSAKTAIKVKKPRKPPKNQPSSLEEDEEDRSRAESPSAKRGSTRVEFTLPEILRQLSAQYTRPVTSNRTRAAIARCYVKILVALDAGVVERSFGQIADHFLTDILSASSVINDRHRLLTARKIVKRILADCVGSSILGEAGRLDAAKILINEVLKNYPQVVKERAEPSKQALAGALDVLASLSETLGSAFGTLGDSCREGLFQVLQHTSYTVQIHAAHCIRAMVLACPQQLLPCATICMNTLNREMGFLSSGRHSARRCVGYANGLATVLSISPLRPLYGSLEVSARVLTMATDLLKSSSKTELRIAGTQIQVAWILIGGLMSLGPNFVKIHLSQFLLLWRNALPRPLTKENTAQRQSAEISYLTHVRECTLGSILSFLEPNGKLVTTDVAKRIATMLQNTMEYLETVPSRKTSDDVSTKSTSSLQILDLVLMVRRRVLQCYAKLITLSPLASGEILSQSNLLNLVLMLFADPDTYTPGSLVSSIANSAGNFDTIWEIADNSGFGICGLVKGWKAKGLPGEQVTPVQSGWLVKDGSQEDFDEEFLTPICGAREHDSVSLHLQGQQISQDLPDPPATEVVNAAITVFALALPLQTAKVQEAVLEQLTSFLSSPSLQKDPGRRAAIIVNTAMALLGTLKVALGETTSEPGDLKHQNIERCLQSILRALIMDGDQFVRNLAYGALGKLCNSSGNTFTTSEVNALIDTIVANRDPNARAGCAMALGAIHTQVGGMAAGLHLKKIHGILLSLCSDPNPTVHFCAIGALSEVAESAGLAFSGYVASTLGLLAQLWTCDSHNEESDALTTSNAEIELPTIAVIAHGVDSLVNVLGPDLQDMSKARELMFKLVKDFEVDDSDVVRAASLRCSEHINLYDPKHTDFPRYVRQLQSCIESPNERIRETAVDGLYTLMRRDAERVLSIAGDSLEDQMWLLLNENPDQEGLRNIMLAWLGQSSLTEAGTWITRCQHVLTRTTKKPADVSPTLIVKASAAPDLQDEEVAGFAASEAKDQESSNVQDVGQELLRWQTRLFAMGCLSDLIAIIGKDRDLDQDSAAGHILQQKVADVVRMAFLASTASVVELRVQGLRLINQILVIFGNTPDPDFSEALLLEQYQAQISSALTPAFGADSSPELASAAVNVCATFIATGLVTDIDRMGRILKFLVTALESFTSDSVDAVVGELQVISSNAKTMVRMAVLSAWAELQVASTEHEYLVKVVQPYVGKLTPLWLASLQEFARLRFEPDISSSMGPPRLDESLDVIYAAMNRQTLLKFYQDSWLKLVDAIASLIDQDSGFVFDALDNKSNTPQINGQAAADRDINYREEPVAFFFILFGIVIEALVTRSGNDSLSSEAQITEILLAMKKILRPSVSGNAIYREVVFSETIELFDRLALTEGLEVQGLVVDIARNLCLTHPSAKDEDEASDHLSDDIEQLFELTRIVVLVLASLLPNLAEHNPAGRPQLQDEGVSLIRSSLEALVDASAIFPSIIKTDLHASILHIFATILGTGVCQALVVPQALPIMRRFLQSIMPDSPSSAITAQLLGCLQRFLAILSNAQRRESEASIPCAKNTLLALTILLTTTSRGLPPNEPLVTQALDAMIDCLQDLGLAKVAANCLRSLLLVNPKTTTDEAIARYIFPRLVLFVTDPSQSDPENTRTIVAHTLTSFTTTLSKDFSRAAAAMSIVMPLLLTRASTHGETLFAETSTRLLELAGAEQGAFRGVVAKMSPEQKSSMESVIREGSQAGRQSDREEKEEPGEPSIALKFNFGRG